MPDIIANLRVDQAWGFFGVSGALHEAGGAYYLTADNVNNGHPADKLGWAAAVGGPLNLAGGDQVGVNFGYAEGAPGFCDQPARCWATMPAPASSLGGSRTACSTPGQRSS